MTMPTPTPKLSWKVMLVAFPLVAVAQAFATFKLTGPLGTSVATLATFLAAYLGMHTEAPAFLVSRPKVASLVALVKAGLAIKLGLLLPLIPDPRLQLGLWLVIALLAYLAGVPLTVGRSGAALPVTEQG